MITVQDGAVGSDEYRHPADGMYSARARYRRLMTRPQRLPTIAGPVTVTHEDVIVSQTCVNRFVVQRTYTVTDVAGNSDTRMQTITVIDDTNPLSLLHADGYLCFDESGLYTIPVLLASRQLFFIHRLFDYRCDEP